MVADRALLPDEIQLSLSREQTFDVMTADGKKIFVYCNRADDTPSNKAVLIGHGLAGSPNSYMHMMARDYFNDRGYDVYRMAFYWDEPGYRVLHDCTLEVQGNDLNAVLDHVRGKHKKMYVCGHSYGGLTLVVANPKADAISFWDSSYQPWDRFWSNAATPTTDGAYMLHWEYDIRIGTPMIEEAKSLTRDKVRGMTARIQSPSQVMVAGASWLHDDTSMLFDDLSCQKERHEIQNAGHTFVEGKTVYELLEKTHEWFERF